MEEGTNFTVTLRITQKERFLQVIGKIVSAFQTQGVDSKLVQISFEDTFTGNRLNK